VLARLLCFFCGRISSSRFFSCFWQNKPCFNEKMNHPVGANPYRYAILSQIKYKKSSAWIAELFVFYT